LRGADPQKYAALYLAELGAERLLWGSDWPWTNHEHGRAYADCLRALHGWLGQEKDEEKILEATPKRLYGFGISQEHAGDR
jgi:predicted TIM-barrel fold metal-dependent hydrolase